MDQGHESGSLGGPWTSGAGFVLSLVSGFARFGFVSGFSTCRES